MADLAHTLTEAGLGLEYDVVRLVDHDPRWIAAGALGSAVLRQVCGAAARDVRHVGSTAVPGLIAKPILDVAVLLRMASDLDEVVARLRGLGLIPRGPSDGGYLLVLESAPSIRVAHVHVVNPGDAEWGRYLQFGDRLRADPAARERYAATKRALADQFPAERSRYTDQKTETIRSLLRPD